MERRSNGSSGDKPGRPKADTTPSTANPRFRRINAAVSVQEHLFVAATRELNGEGVCALNGRLRADLQVFVRVADFTAVGRSTFAARRLLVAVDPASVIRAHGGPEKWADRKTGWLLGHGPHWYRDNVVRSPWPPGQRLRYAPPAKRASEMARHPGRFDHFTREERLFLRLPGEVQTAIEVAVRRKWRPETENYYNLPPSDRGPPPSELRDLVWAVVAALPKKKMARVFRLCVRPIRRPATVGMNDLPPVERRKLGHEEEGDNRGEQAPHFYETPVPVLGKPKSLPFKPRR